MFKRLVCGIILLAFGLTGVIPPSAYSQNIPNTPANILSLTPAFHPVMIQGMRVHPENPLRFDFIVDTGDAPVDVNGDQFKEETIKLIKYFLASLTVPEKEMWVNLSPYEKNRIIANGLGRTELGRDMLSQDYILKQLTSSLIYPDSTAGKFFWEKVYAKARETFGRTDIPVNTFNKVWIVPDKAVVYEHGNTVYIAESHLKAMLEQDYLALKKNTAILSTAKDLNRIHSLRDSSATPQNDVNALGSQIVRAIVLPELEKEVNTGRSFANLRQIYNAMILAVWFKINLQKSLLGQVYADKNKTRGVDAADKTFRQKIYEQYVRSFKKGVYNYIREENDPVTGAMIPRKYFSGGFVGLDRAMLSEENGEKGRQEVLDHATGTRVVVDAAMLKEVANGKPDRPGQNAHTGSSAPLPSTDIVKTFTEGSIVNTLLRYPEQRVAVHISESRSRPEVIIAMPLKNTAATFRLMAQSGARWQVAGTSPVVEALPGRPPKEYRGVDIEFSTNKERIILKKSDILERDVIGLRDIIYSDMDIPWMEERLMEQIRRFPPDLQVKLAGKIGINVKDLKTIIIPQIKVDHNENGSHSIVITKTTFAGNHYRLLMDVSDEFDVEDRNGSIIITSKIKDGNFQNVRLKMRATTDFEPLTFPTFDEIYTKEALEWMEKDPESKAKAENFALLFYGEKVLGGSWIYPAFFGRDTQYAARFMWPVLTKKAKMIIVRSLLDRSDKNGLVAVNDETSEERLFWIKVTEAYNKWLDQNEGALNDVKSNKLYSLFISVLEERRVLSYDVLDPTFLFSGTQRLLFDDLSGPELDEFLNEKEAQGEKNIIKLLRHWNTMLKFTNPNTQATWAFLHKHGLKSAKELKGLLLKKHPGPDELTVINEFHSSSEFQPGELNEAQAKTLIDVIETKRRFKVPGGGDAIARINKLLKNQDFGKILFPRAKWELSPQAIRLKLEEDFPKQTPKRLATQLVRKMRDAVAGWRDSNPGYGWGKHVLELNILASISIKNIAAMIDRLEKLGLNVRDLADKNGFHMLRDYLVMENGIGFDQAKEAWSIFLEHFKTHVSLEDTRALLKEYLRSSPLSEEDKESLRNALINKRNEPEKITLRQFLYENKTPEWLKDGFIFTNIAIDTKIINSDILLFLMEEDLDLDMFKRIHDELSMPFPIGGWSNEVGQFIANAIFSDNKQIKDVMDKKEEYHGFHALWSKELGGRTYGIIRQMENAGRRISEAKQNGNRQDHIKQWEENIKQLEMDLEEIIELGFKLGLLRASEVWTWEGKNGRMIPIPYRQSRYVSRRTFNGLPDGREIFNWLKAEGYFRKNGYVTEDGEEKVHPQLFLSDEKIELLESKYPGHYEEILDILRTGQPSGNPQAWANEAFWFKPQFQNALEAFRKRIASKIEAGEPVAFKVPSKTDPAMFTEKGASVPGGIDLNPVMLDLQTKRDGKGMTFPAAADGMMQVNGFTPVIIRITPMASPLLSDSG